MSLVHLHILGDSVVEVGKQAIEPDSPQLFTLALYLGSAYGKPALKSELLQLLFADARNEGRALHSLRQLLYRLRRMGAPLVVAGQHISIPRSQVEIDLEAVLELVPNHRATAIAPSVAILPHCGHPCATAAVWIETYRTRMQNILRERLTDDIQWFRERADWQAVDLVARRVLELDPLNETATLCLAEAVARTGAKANALALLETYERDIGSASPELVLPSQLLRKRILRLSQRSPASLVQDMPLLGRGQEMALLTTLWNQCHKDGFRSVVVRGDKSSGKSRILQELRAVVELEGSGTVVFAQPSAHDRARPLALFTEIVGKLLPLPGAAGCDPANVSLLRRLTDVTAPTGPISANEPHTLYDDARLRNALSDLVSSVSDERSLLCIVDDAQHLDLSSLDMLRAVMRRASTSPALFVLAERTNPGANLSSADNDVPLLALSPLSHDASADLLARMCNRVGLSLTPADAEWHLETAAGNPGHLELLVEHYLSSRHHRAVPLDLVTLTDVRLTMLSSEAKHVLEAIAIAGNGISPEGVARLTGLGGYPLLAALGELDRNYLLRQTDQGLRCRSALIADRAIVAASAVAIAVMHGRAAELLECDHPLPHMTAAAAWRIASHWKAAGQPKRARERMRACWQQAIDIGQPMGACESIQRELERSSSSEERAVLLDDLIGALQAAGEHVQAHAAILERQGLSAQVADSSARRHALAFDLTESETLLSYSHLKHITAVLRHAESVELDPLRRLRSARIGMVVADGRLDQDLAAKVFAISQHITADDDRSDLLQRHVGLIYHTVFGDPDSALSLASDIERMVARRDRSWSRLQSRRICSLARQLVGQEPIDYEELERDYFECLDGSMTVNALACAAHTASILIDDGDIVRAREWMQKAEALVGLTRGGGAMVTYLSGQVDLALLAGDEGRARQFLAQMQSNSQLYNWERLWNDLLLYRLRVEQVCCSASATPAELTELLRFHDKGKRLGRHDDHMDVLWVALVTAGRAEEASRLLSEYLHTHRRERRACRSFLQTRTQSDPAWTTITPSRADVAPRAASEL